MARAAHSIFIASSGAVLLTVACSGGQIAVGRTDQQLQTRRDGSPTGDGQTCSWEGTAAHDTASDSANAASPVVVGPYNLGESFASLDGCNECTCTERGIMCTMRACEGAPKEEGPACDMMLRICQDGSDARPGSKPCEQVCPEDGPQGCRMDARRCPDGKLVGRVPPSCDFAPCGETVCTDDVKQCPDGSFVARMGPNCEFAPCPTKPVACATDVKQCPDGSFVGRTGPNCEFAPCL
jgi:hypothetical protein